MELQPQKRRRSQDLSDKAALDLEEWTILQKAKRLRIGVQPDPNTPSPPHSDTLPAASSNSHTNVHNSGLRPIIISTRSHANPSTPPSSVHHTPTLEPSSEAYSNINSYLRNLHVKRHGDPELHERWWEKDEIDSMDMDDEVYESASEYSAINSVLRQAFLRRHGSLPPDRKAQL
ncbi:hypothetical protein VKS41_006465 [Umbelopsis sp. WA50703]